MMNDEWHPVEEFAQFAKEFRLSCAVVGILIVICVLAYVFR